MRTNEALNAGIAEARALLEACAWNTNQGAALEGRHAAILMNPRPAEEAGRWNVTITVRLLGGQTAALDGAPLLVRPADGGPVTYYGRLSRRGQLRFCGLEAG